MTISGTTANTNDFLIRGHDYLDAAKDFELIGRDEELEKLAKVLMRKRASSVLLVGAGGTGASAICMGLQASKDNPEAPFDIVGKRFFWLDTDGLFASGDINKINESFDKTLRTLSRSSNTVLVIDDMKDFIEAARNNGTPNLINSLLREIKQNEFQAILESRDADLDVVLKAHSDMQESFTLIDVSEPDAEDLQDIVRNAAERLEAHHKIKISDDAVQSAIELTNKYRVNDLGLRRAQPERSLTLLDRALTTYRIAAHARDPNLDALQGRLDETNAALESGESSVSKEELEALKASLESDIKETGEAWADRQKQIKSLYKDMRKSEEKIRDLEDELDGRLEFEAEERKRAAQVAEDNPEAAPATREGRQAHLSALASSMEQGNFGSDEVNAIRDKIRKYQSYAAQASEKFNVLTSEINDTLELGRDNVLTEFSNISGVPVSKLTQNERAKLLQLDTNLGNRVYGQGEAVNKLSNQVRVARAGLQDPNKPQAAFLFLGPSGVGKTELSKALTAELLDDERALLRFDMSEYMEKHAVAKLIGAPPGYEGYEAGGILTNEMRKNPRRIILFDEIEKAHPDVFNVFLQILDDARLTDNRGLTVSFRDAIILMTTNIGTKHFLEEENFDDAKVLALNDLDEQYRPEFLNRFNGRQNIVCFNKLGLPVIEKIAARELGKLNRMIQAGNPEQSVDMPAEDLEAMCADHYAPVNGARGITGYIEGKIKPEIANTVLFSADAKGVITINYDKEKKDVVISPPKTPEPVNSFAAASQPPQPAPV